MAGAGEQADGRRRAAGDPFAAASIRAAYDAAASAYEATYGDDLDRLPLDRQMLDQASAAAGPGGVVLDLGCGTGMAGGHLLGRHRVVGLDLSPGMLAAIPAAKRLPVVCADMRRLPLADGSVSSVVAFYVVQHLRRGELATVLHETARVLRPGGVVLLAAHLGDGEVTANELAGLPTRPFGGTLYSIGELTERLTAAGLVVLSHRERGPLGHEHPSERAYLLARLTP
ncbi:MAG: class I SAM-dependent methyltransferase [Acidimicrobiales bacterium]